MTTNFRLLAMAAVAMLAMNSCVKEENLNNGDKKGTPVEFEMGVNSVSRTNTPDDGYATTFVEGDEVGIFVYNGEKAVVKNAHYKRNANGKWVAQGEAITAEEGVSYSYYAYYPYNSEATDATSVSLTVAGDQTTGYTGSDALMAKSENVEAGTTTVPLQYSHAFALVQVSLKGELAAKDATVTLQNVYPTAALNLITETAGEASGTLGTVAMKACSTNGESAPFNYRAIVPAQTITANNGILTTTSNGKSYKFTYSVDVPYESGKLRQFDVTLGGATGNKIEIGQGTISDWTDGSDVEGGEGSVGDVVEPINSILVPITAETQATVGGKYSSTSLLNMEEEGWFSRYASDYGASLTFAKDTVTIAMPDTTNLGVELSTGWNNCSFGYHANGPLAKVSGEYKFSCKITGDIGSQGGIMVRTSTDKEAFTIITSSGFKTINTFTTSTATQVVTFTLDLTQKSSKATSNEIKPTDKDPKPIIATDDSDLTDIYVYIYNNKFNTKFSISDIKLERITQ